MTSASFSSRELHFIGIGGVGMSGLALVAKALGAQVTGSDNVDTPFVKRLRAHGIEPAIGYDAQNVPADAEVVVSSAIHADNPELAAAREADATVLHRGQLLGDVTRLKRSIAVAGTHGKTTTCGMLAHTLLACGREPAYLIGGELRSTSTNAAWGAGEWLVVEADESDRSFLELARDVAVITNVELDHHSTYRSRAELDAAFQEFTDPAGLRILGEGVKLPDEGAVVRYGIDEGDLRAEELELLPLGSRFQVDGVQVELNVPGAHNVCNALATLAACRAAGVELAEAAAGLQGFSGTGRRFESAGRTPSGARIFDDYAHHPTEVRATLEAARNFGARRVVACFQPHLFSRTRELADEFGRALALADVVLVLDVYPSRERAEDFPGVTGLLVAAAAADAAQGRPVWWLPTVEDAEEMLRAELREGDLVLTMGAGDVDRLASALASDQPPEAV
jgi:UDP-N-acetylmuramate--alanine ligase